MSLKDDKEYQHLKDIVISKEEARFIIDHNKVGGHWVKDMEHRFFDITEEAAQILYGLTTKECFNKTDLEIATEQGLVTTSTELFTAVCRGSDEYILNNPINGMYQVKTFIEMITSAKGEKHIWRVTKMVVPPIEGLGSYLFGQAEFLDRIMGYEKALNMVKKDPNLIKLNSCLYVYR